MAKFDITHNGYRFQYNQGNYLVVRREDTPLGAPYDMMQIPAWVNREQMTNDVMETMALTWSEQRRPVGPTVRVVNVVVTVLVVETDYEANYGTTDDIDEYTAETVRSAAAVQLERVGWGMVADPALSDGGTR